MPTRDEFAASIKAKYPEYESVDDSTLVDKMLEKYPEYKDRVTNGPIPEGHGMGDLKALENQAPEPDKSSLFPAAIKEYNDRFYQPAGSIGQSIKDIGAVGAAGIGDVGGILQRGLAAALTDQKMSDPGAHLLKNQTASAAANAVTAANLADKPAGYVPPGVMWQPPAIAPAATETLGRAADDPLSYTGILAKTLSYIPRMAEGLGGAAGVVNSQAGKLASTLSGVPEEALRAYGNPIERAKMAANYGREQEIGSDLLNHIDNPDKFLPERALVDASLQKMGPISVEDAAKALEAKKIPETGRTFDYERIANKKIQGFADDLRGAPGTDPSLPATDFRDLRKRLDVQIDHNTEEGKLVNTALKSGRATMKNDLIAKAMETGDQGYVDAMKSWSSKIDKLDQLKSILGKNATTRDKRIESFVSNLFGKNNAYKEQLMKDLDGVFQSDVVGRAKSANMAASLGEGGEPSLMPRQVTGASLKAGLLANLIPGVGQAAAIATASPRIAATFTLPMLTKLETGLKAAGVAMTPRAASALEAMKKPISDVVRARLAAVLAAELESQLPANTVPFRQKVAGEDSVGDQQMAMQ